MSIETEFQSTIQNVQNAYNGLNNLGATIPQNKNIENIKSCLDEIYDNLPKTEYQEGTEINLGKTIKGKLDYENGVVGIGQTEQYTTTGKNLFEPVLSIDGTDIVRSGVSSISVNNGEYTLVASAADMYFGQVLASGSTYIDSRGVKIYANGNEKISYKISNTEINRMFITAYDSNGTSLGYVAKIGSSQGTYVFPTNCDFVTFRIGKGDAVSGTTYKFNVMVAYGDEIPDYESYTGGYSSPSPNWKQEIKYVRGWNILNQDKLKYGTISQSDGTTISPSGDVLYLDDYIPIKPSSYYTFRSNRASYLVRLFYYDRNKNYINTETKSGTFQTISTAYYLRVQCSVTVNDEFQLVEGNVNLPYLPYNTIEEVVSGKNLFDYSIELADCWISANNGAYLLNKYNTDYIDVSKTNNGYYVNSYNNTNYRWFSVPITLPKNKELKINIGSSNIPSDTSSGTNVKIYGYNSLSANQTGTQVCANYRESFNSGDFNYYTLCFYPYQQGRYLYDIMIIDNDITDLTYEPYITPTSYQLSLGDIQLNAIGNYKDELIYDVDEDKVYKGKKINYTTLGSFARLYTTEVFEVSKQYGYLQFTDSKSLGNPSYNFYCDRVSKSNGVANDYSGFFNAKNFVVLLNDNDTLTTANEKISGSNFYYVLNEEVKEEITDTTLINQVKALYNAHSNNGTTIITSNGDLPMIIKVRGLKGE